MPEPLRLKGIPASPGYAEGPLFPIDRPTTAYVAKRDRSAEAAALEQALSEARAQIAALMSQADGDAGEILEFQFVMLEDDGLYRPAFDRVAAGETAYEAWAAALREEIAGYEASGEEYFRARSVDLRDIRDRVLASLTADAGADVPAGAILFGDDLAPTRFLATDWSRGGGIALTAGSSASHVAMLARSRGVPMVVGLGAVGSDLPGVVLLDAENGAVLFGAEGEAAEQFRRSGAEFSRRRELARAYLHRPGAMNDGTPVRVQVNIADPSDVDSIDIECCDGVGLMRTEFLFGKSLPDEETQYRAYRKVLEWANGKPVTIRTIDAGGDKPVLGFTVQETNPFLGLRGIRLSLAKPEIFRVQIRALLRSAVHGNLKVMLPMIGVRDELVRTRALFEEEAANLGGAGIAHAIPPLGIMVEVPSTAIVPSEFADAAFFSIGSNDLTQYVMAAARDNTAVSGLNSVRHPAVLRLIASVAAFGRENGIPVSLCGDAGGDPAAIPALLEAGLRDLSVVPAQLAVAKATIASVAV
jgi:phosphotransferase system enzyme I (PtsI)